MPLQKPDDEIFYSLYRAAYERCFHSPLRQPLTEPESKLFFQQLLEHTGLSIGWRSLKNYSFYVLAVDRDKEENPSTATLDTLARYVLKAPYTTELKRKDEEEHYPYWFLYREHFLKNEISPSPKRYRKLTIPMWIIGFVAFAVIVAAGYFWVETKFDPVYEDFADVSEKTLDDHGWTLQNIDQEYWQQRSNSKKGLTLFTLTGDNWPDSTSAPSIKNLLIHLLPRHCFTAELHMENFIPNAEWQQAGLLLLEDTSLNSKSIRISLAYNDFFGGYKRPREVLVQAISSPGNGINPEEFAHSVVLFTDSAAKRPILLNGLAHTALRIEKQGKSFRFLYSGGATSNAAFKEISSREFTFEPHYIGIFALKGFVKNTPIAPVTISKFRLDPALCN